MCNKEQQSLMNLAEVPRCMRILIGRASEELEHLSSDKQRTPIHFCPQSVFFCSLSTAVCFAVRLDG